MNPLDKGRQKTPKDSLAKGIFFTLRFYGLVTVYISCKPHYYNRLLRALMRFDFHKSRGSDSNRHLRLKKACIICCLRNKTLHNLHCSSIELPLDKWRTESVSLLSLCPSLPHVLIRCSSDRCCVAFPEMRLDSSFHAYLFQFSLKPLYRRTDIIPCTIRRRKRYVACKSKQVGGRLSKTESI